ncbi:MAG: glycosyltransferase family 2 protein [Pyrinomonadaceae bacterium]
MPTYNCADKVEKTLRSVLSQNEELYELIIVDGASTDDTVERLGNFESNFTLVSESDNGIYNAFNKGIDLATGRYIYFIGAGDCLRPGILAQLKDLLPLERPTLVYGKCYFVKNRYFDGRELKTTDFSWTNICHQGEFYHRSIFTLVGKYDERYKVFSDWLLNLKCFLSGEIETVYIPVHIADFEEDGISSNLDNDPVFKKEFPVFVRRNLGLKAFFICKFKMMKPNSVYFSHGVGYPLVYETLQPLISLIRPYYRKYLKGKLGK